MGHGVTTSQSQAGSEGISTRLFIGDDLIESPVHLESVVYLAHPGERGGGGRGGGRRRGEGGLNGIRYEKYSKWVFCSQ